MGKLREIGSSLTKPYNYTKPPHITDHYISDEDNMGKSIISNFKTDSGLKYMIGAYIEGHKGENYLSIAFSVDPKPGQNWSNQNIERLTGKGEVFRIMSTIISFAYNIYNNNSLTKNIKGIIYKPSKVGKEESGRQRDILYKKYIKKQFPNVKFKNKDGSVYAIIGENKMKKSELRQLIREEIQNLKTTISETNEGYQSEFNPDKIEREINKEIKMLKSWEKIYLKDAKKKESEQSYSEPKQQAIECGNAINALLGAIIELSKYKDAMWMM